MGDKSGWKKSRWPNIDCCAAKSSLCHNRVYTPIEEISRQLNEFFGCIPGIITHFRRWHLPMYLCLLLPVKPSLSSFGSPLHFSVFGTNDVNLVRLIAYTYNRKHTCNFLIARMEIFVAPLYTVLVKHR